MREFSRVPGLPCGDWVHWEKSRLTWSKRVHQCLLLEMRLFEINELDPTRWSDLGERLDEFGPRDLRWLLVGGYDIRYKIAGGTAYLLPLWHTQNTDDGVYVE